MASTPSITIAPTLEEEMRAIGEKARAAAALLREASSESKARALLVAAEAILAGKEKILAANSEDLRSAESRHLSPALLDRIRLDPARMEAMSRGLREVAGLPDPVGRELSRWTRPNGLDIARVATPIGVLAIIYESRPNVTADAGALCLKSGNAAILRSGSEAARSSAAIHSAMAEGLRQANLPEAVVQMVPTTDRDAVGMILSGLSGAIDLIVPRGGKSLVGRVQKEARVPVLAHLEGICHTYVHAAADLIKARALVLNGKMRRTGICGATETLLVDRGILSSHLSPILDDLAETGCEIRGDEEVRSLYPSAMPATEMDWRTEYLDAIIAVRTVSGLEEAIAHIARFGSQHTECIVTEDKAAAERFLSSVDSAIVLHNASTQFADGGEFGMGAEIGIGTGKLHARGPVGVEQLTTFKYIVRGTGQTRV